MLPFAVPAALSRVPWKLALGATLLLALAVQTIRLSHSERRADKAIFERNEARQALKDLAEESRKQIAETGKTVERIITVEAPDADRRARKVEGAKLPGGCKTPAEVIGADI